MSVDSTHQHPSGEVDQTISAAKKIAALVTGCPVGLNSSEEFDWRPLSLPILIGEQTLLPNDHVVEGTGAFGAPVPYSRALHRAMGGALLPGLGFAAWSLDSLLEDQDGMMHPTGPQPWLRPDLLAAFQSEGLATPTLFMCRPQHDVDGAGPVVPHAILGVTKNGSLAGVIGFTEWA